MKKAAKRRSAAEIAQARAAALLERVKPYDEWLATAGQERLARAEKLAGSPRRAYDAMVRELLRMAGPGYTLPAPLK